MRPSTLYLVALLSGSAILCFLMVVYPAIRKAPCEYDMLQKKDLVRRLKLTDLCLFTEARYTRHLSQADLFSAFQDNPMSFEHFPSGSLTLPPVLNQRNINR